LLVVAINTVYEVAVGLLISDLAVVELSLINLACLLGKVER